MRKNNLLSKGIILGIIVLFVGTSIQSVMSTETPSVMTTSGEISGGSVIIVDDEGDGHYVHIEDAIENAEDGDTIEVYSGTYANEDVTIDKRLILIGIDEEYPPGSVGDTGKPIIKRSGYVVTIAADGVTVEGFVIKDGSFGIGLVGYNGCTIFWNDILNNTVYGIIMMNSFDNNITGNTIEGNNNGVNIISGDNNNIHHNNFIDNAVHNAYDAGNNIWNDSYDVFPAGGNYWSDFHSDGQGAYDEFSGPDQLDGPGNPDNIVDGGLPSGGLNPRDIPGNGNQDMYPLREIYGPFIARTHGPYHGFVHKPVDFHGSASNGIEPYNYSWDFGDGNQSWGQEANNTYHVRGTYTVTLTVTDDLDHETNDTTTVTITEITPPEVKIIKPGKAIYINNNEVMPFFTTIIIGEIDIEVEASDNKSGDSGMSKVKFYIDGFWKETVEGVATPYSYAWTEKASGFKHTIKVTAYDNLTNIRSDEITVWKFL